MYLLILFVVCLKDIHQVNIFVSAIDFLAIKHLYDLRYYISNERL